MAAEQSKITVSFSHPIANVMDFVRHSRIEKLEKS